MKNGNGIFSKAASTQGVAPAIALNPKDKYAAGTSALDRKKQTAEKLLALGSFFN